MPPTPAPSLPSPSRPASTASDTEQPLAGPSGWHTRPLPLANLPPTPPSLEDDRNPSLHFEEPKLPSRRLQPARRPVSAYPAKEPDTHRSPHRKYTDPTPRTHRFGLDDQLDVDLDAYAGSGFETDETREPTLSFVTTSAEDSASSTPSIGGNYGYSAEPHVDGKQPMIRTRQGRSHAYSSAESSMASGAYSGYGYSDHVYHPPPLPQVPNAYTEHVGLGITAEPPLGPRSQVDSPHSEGISPWSREVAHRMRSESISSSITTASLSTSESGPSSSRIPPLDNTYYSYDSYRWEPSRSEAVALIDEGVTHLLLPSCGSHILSFLPALISILAPSLVVLDISNNDLSFLPSTLANCSSLEELNVSSNPLRQLPSFFGDLIGLQVLAVDNCSVQSLPVELSLLGSLHTLCARQNKMISLPSWLCLLNHLETLKIDGNPFAPEWAAILAPILSAPSRSRPGSHNRHLSINNGLQSPASIPLTSSLTASSLRDPAAQATTSLHLGVIAEDQPRFVPIKEADSTRGGGLRKMRSAGSLLGKLNTNTQSSYEVTSPPSTTERLAPPVVANKFASLGSSQGRRAASAMGNYQTTLQPPASTSKTSGKWGFLRKMSMHRLRDKDKAATIQESASSNLRTMPQLPHMNSDPVPTLPRPNMPSTRSAMTLPTQKSVLPAELNEFGQITEAVSNLALAPSATAPVHNKRRSYLPLDLGPPSINVSIPPTSPFIAPLAGLDGLDRLPRAASEGTIATMTLQSAEEARQGLESIKSYLRDLFDLSRPPIEPYGGFEVVGSADGSCGASSAPSDNLGSPMSSIAVQNSEARRARRPTLDTQPSRAASVVESEGNSLQELDSGKKYKNDRSKRAKIIREIYETERTYVRGLGELISIYVKPAGQAVNPNKSNETVIPAAERKIVFGGIESILTIHRDNFLPALEKAVKTLLEGQDDEEGNMSAAAAHSVGEVFRTYIAYMKQYSTYINNFDNALSRMQTWSAPSSTPNTPAFSSKPSTPNVGISQSSVSVGMSVIANLSDTTTPTSGSQMTASQKKRVKTFLKRCKEHPKHSQINLESYLLLPIQRVPRYKLLLEDLAMCTPPRSDGIRDTLDDALNEIASLASLMNEEKREADSRLRLLSWQQRITKSGPSPLVQPHRRLILEGPLRLIRLVKKNSTFVEADSMPYDDQTITAPSKVVVPVEYIKPELVDRPVMLVLCSDLMVLATQRGEGWEGAVDLFNVLRMATLREPASIVHDNVLRVVDNKSIYYFDGASHEETIQWCRAINSARRR
ncbi:hypothetical protein IAU60_003443 [Kwoniella sp. DSM 27419]